MNGEVEELEGREREWAELGVCGTGKQKDLERVKQREKVNSQGRYDWVSVPG